MTGFDSPLWKDPALAARALDGIRRLLDRRGRGAQFMEVCGTHTMAIAAGGLRRLLPEGLRMLSGPGCPVCVTAPGDVDRMLALAALPGVAIATFGDMMKVRGSSGSLETARREGGDVRVVYSPLDALDIARAEPGKSVVFLGVGFETTAPAVAAALVRARDLGLSNFLVLPLFKLVPPALKAVLADPSHEISGFLLPGHVSAVIGSAPYAFVASDHGLPCVIAGFEPMDILDGIHRLMAQLSRGEAKVEIEYSRGVKAPGNPAALAVLERVFEPADAHWRAVGKIPRSGLVPRGEFAAFDALRRFDVPFIDAPEPAGCLCGRVLMGKASPPDCALFGKECTPASAIGPCMVSSEGACAAWYKHGG